MSTKHLMSLAILLAGRPIFRKGLMSFLDFMYCEVVYM